MEEGEVKRLIACIVLVAVITFLVAWKAFAEDDVAQAIREQTEQQHQDAIHNRGEATGVYY